MLKRWFFGFLAFFGMALPALASSHSAPAPDTFIGGLMWEVEHFLIHMSMTLDALTVTVFSGTPAFGMALLADQTLCASQSVVTSMLFSTPLAAVLSALVTLALVATLVYQVVKTLATRLIPRLRGAPRFA